MPHVEKHASGSFNWIELATTDQGAAKQFYGALLGWQASDFPIGPNHHYTLFMLDGRVAAGCQSIRPGQQAPPNWGVFIATDDADRCAVQAAKLGGTILLAPGDVAAFGRNAVIQDPAGAVFSIWQAGSHFGTGIAGENGTLSMADLNTPDRERAKTFYQALFGWRFVIGKDKPADSYLHIKHGETYIGGILPDSHRNASTAKAVKLGARVHVSPISIGNPENSLRYSVLADPQGALFALFQGSA